MKDRDKSMGNKNPTIESMLEHLAQASVNQDGIDLWSDLRVRLAASKILSKRKETSMKKRLVLPAFAVMLGLALVAVFVAKNVTSVSARSVLDKASAAQSQTRPSEGIEHMRIEVYSNYQALPEDQGLDTTVESYHDIQSGKSRTVTTDTKTGKVLDASSYGGPYTYSRDYSQENTNGSSGPLVLYRTPQGKLADSKVSGGYEVSARKYFEQMRNDPKVQLVGQETWPDGRVVYVLKSHQQVKVAVNNGAEVPQGLVIVSFDARTYEQVGYQMLLEKDGKQLLISSLKVLVNEVLPAGSPVSWDLSDLKDITIIDDPNREHGDLLPEVITPQQLAAHTKTAYLLKAVPDGYALEISEPQSKRGSTEPYTYIASYSTPNSVDFVIQSMAATESAQPSSQAGDVEETYTTASGLVMYFMKESPDPSGRQYTSALVDAPDKVTFIINSTLPREMVKAWAEQLTLVK
jgi:hypothetical protein